MYPAGTYLFKRFYLIDARQGKGFPVPKSTKEAALDYSSCPIAFWQKPDILRKKGNRDKAKGETCFTTRWCF